MSRKLAQIFYQAGILTLLIGLSLWGSSTVFAQCGDPPPKSSCITCHEKEDPVYQNGEWHGIHALKDCCTNCHGGNCRMMDKTLAHEGLVAHPLDDIYTNCYQCHPYDYQERASRFGALLGVIPQSRETPTPPPTGPVKDQPIVILPEIAPGHTSTIPWPGILFGTIVSIAIVIGFGLLFYRLRTS